MKNEMLIRKNVNRYLKELRRLKKSNFYITLQSEIRTLENTILSKSNFLKADYILWTTSNISKLVKQINLEKIRYRIS